MLLDELKTLLGRLQAEKLQQFRRRVSIGDLLQDRWEIASQYGFGEGSSCYDNVLILGDVKVGRNVWIGPNVVLDGSGGLQIGDWCSISAGTHVYSHDTVERALTGGRRPPRRKPVRIGDCTYIGPQSIVVSGITIGSRAVVGALSFVNCDVPDETFVAGAPARPCGRVVVDGEMVDVVPL